MQIPFTYTKIKGNKYRLLIAKKIQEIIKKGSYLRGEENEQLTKNLTTFLYGGYLVTTASGHDSLFLAMQSLKLKPDDEVIFPVNSYPTAFPIAQTNCKIVPVDVNDIGLIDEEDIEKKISKKTKAIVVVHLYGLNALTEKIKTIATALKITLIEDCAQSFGTLYQGKPLGTFGGISCFSFYPTKNLGTMGEGGAIWTSNKQLFDYFRKAVNYGESIKHASSFISSHSRLPEIQAGILNVYFKKITSEIQLRKKNFASYNRFFNKYKLMSKIRILYKNNDTSPVLHLLVVEVNERNQLIRYLEKNGVESHIHYPYPVHLVPAFSYLGYGKGSFPMAERLAQNILSLPFHPYLAESQIEYVVKIIHNFYYV